ncbi:MAG: hypothetical protein ACREIU_09865 [Planctomycetota bacterium]
MAVGLLLSAASAASHAVYVNVETGDDRNLGRTPGAAVETITRALEIASRNLDAPWTICIAGRVDEEGAVLAYDDDPATAAPSRERFPLPMLRGVSLVWDREHSDIVPLGPDGESFEFVRPLVRSAFGQVVLAESSQHPLSSDVLSEDEPLHPADRTVTLRGLDFEGGARPSRSGTAPTGPSPSCSKTWGSATARGASR